VIVSALAWHRRVALRRGAAFACCVAVLLAAAPAHAQEEDDPFAAELPLIVVDSVGTVVDHDARIAFAPGILATTGDSAALIVRRNGVYLEFVEGVLRGAPADADPERLDGVGVLVEAEYVTLENLVVEGYRVGVRARQAHGLVLSGVNVRGGARARLHSTWERADPRDRLDHRTADAGQWPREHGAAFAIEDTFGFLVSKCRARAVQNGLVLAGVEEGVITSNDFSFLSGWGLVIARSHGNLVAGNRFDFCVRGYAEGRYAAEHGAGAILVVDESSKNHFERNRTTHGGDGAVLFGGGDAIAGTGNAPPGSPGRGANHNTFDGNDFSDAVRRGVDADFGFGNTVRFNRIVGNSQGGVRLGHVRDTLIEGNWFENNGDAPGLDAAPGLGLAARANVFVRSLLGVRLAECDAASQQPWFEANPPGQRSQTISDNEFIELERGIEVLRTAGVVILRNLFESVAEPLVVPDGSGAGAGARERAHELRQSVAASSAAGEGPRDAQQLKDLRANRLPPIVGAQLAGRRWIALGPFGPHDWEAGAPLLQPLAREPRAHTWRLLATLPQPEDKPAKIALEGNDTSTLEVVSATDPDGISLDAWRVVLREPSAAPRLHPYLLRATASDGRTAAARGVLIDAAWTVRAARVTAEGAADPAELEAAIKGAKSTSEHPALPSDLGEFFAAQRAVEGASGFVLRARTAVVVPAGRWALEIVTRAGVRLRIDAALRGAAAMAQRHPRAVRAEWEQAEEAPVAIEFDLFDAAAPEGGLWLEFTSLEGD